MATGTLIVGSSPEHRDLAYWMDRVVKELEKLQSAPDDDTVHDLRVAIRRCRSIGAVMQEVDPNPTWGEMRKLPRKLFRELGRLRDAQVLEVWTKTLSAEGDPLRDLLLAEFSEKEKELREDTLRVAAKFDLKCWKRLTHDLRRRARLVRADGRAAECLALERLEEAKRSHAQAFRATKPEAWHALRIGLKKFRYTVEGLLPAKYAEWGDNLKKVQDLLGDVHDLDVLAEKTRLLAPAGMDGVRVSWMARLGIETNRRLEDYRLLTMGKANLWHEWRQGLPEGKRLEAAALARLNVTVRAVDENPRRSGRVSALATKLYDGLGKVHAAPVFGDENLRKIMRAAAKVHAIGSGLDRKRPQKAAREFLMDMAVPAGWSTEEWKLMAMVVRYHRGKQPDKKQKSFANLSELERGEVCAGAGVLRLARVLSKYGAQNTVGLRMEKSVDAVIVSVPGLIDTEETAAGIAAGKYLLETCIACPLLLKAVPAATNLVEMKKQVEAAVGAS